MTNNGITIFGIPAIVGNTARVSLENSATTNGLSIQNNGLAGVFIKNAGQKGLVI